MANDPFDNPGSGASFEAKDHKGKLLLITPLEHKDGVQTKSFGIKDVMIVDLVILDESNPGASEVLTGVYLFGSKLIGQTRGKIGKLVLGRLGQVDVGKGNPAWNLADPTDADRAIGSAYLATKAPQL